MNDNNECSTYAGSDLDERQEERPRVKIYKTSSMNCDFAQIAIIELRIC